MGGKRCPADWIIVFKYLWSQRKALSSEKSNCIACNTSESAAKTRLAPRSHADDAREAFSFDELFPKLLWAQTWGPSCVCPRARSGLDTMPDTGINYGTEGNSQALLARISTGLVQWKPKREDMFILLWNALFSSVQETLGLLKNTYYFEKQMRVLRFPWPLPLF